MLDSAAKSNGMSQRALKLVLDFRRGSRRGGHMDDDDADLIVQLCARAGMIMEDMSAPAITLRGKTLAERRDVNTRLQVAARRIGALAEAAKALSK